MLVSTVYLLHRIVISRFLKGFHFESLLQAICSLWVSSRHYICFCKSLSAVLILIITDVSAE